MVNMPDPEQEWEAEGEYEDEREYEDEGFDDKEYEDEQFLSGLVDGIGKVLGLSEGEYEDEGYADQEYEYEGYGDQEYEDEGYGDQEYEDEGEPFLPALLPIAKMALPLISGLFRKRRRNRSRELEFEDEFKAEGFGDQEYEDEVLGLGQGEFEDESFFEMAQNAGAAPPAMAEVLAAMAAEAQSESEAEAFIGAATVMTLSPREQRTLERLLPQLLRAMAVLTKLLRRQPATRRVIRVIPSVIKATSVPLTRAAVRGHPPATSVVGRVLTRQTRTALITPRVTSTALRRNAAVVNRVAPRLVSPQAAAGRRRVPARRAAGIRSL